MRAQIGVLPQKDTTLHETTDEKFKVGDEWEYRTRKSEETSTLLILKIESSPELGVIVHVGVNKIRLANCHGGREPDSVPHMPFARRALDDSVTSSHYQTTRLAITSGRKPTQKSELVSTS